MSPSTHTPLDRIADRAPMADPHRLRTASKAVSFWVGALLPVTYAPMLWGGVTGGEGTILSALLLLNVVALVLGHDHRAEEAGTPHR